MALSQKQQTGVIEITPEMVDAGVEILAERYGIVGPFGAQEIAEDVFRAMLAVLTSGHGGTDS
jgi:hypothetical protein